MWSSLSKCFHGGTREAGGKARSAPVSYTPRLAALIGDGIPLVSAGGQEKPVLLCYAVVIKKAKKVFLW